MARLLVLLGFWIGAAAVAADPCQAPTVQRIDRPHYPHIARGPVFSYAFEVTPGSDPLAPVVIVLPGGPGQTTIGSHSLPLPDGVTAVWTDPRGIGCNAPPKDIAYPDDFFDTQFLARDVLAVVRHLELEEYYLYGTSYGSALATVTAALAREEGVTAPKAVLLEGVVGRAYRGTESHREYLAQWDRVRGGLAADVRDVLEGGNLPFGQPVENWISFLRLYLMVGELPGSGDPLAAKLAGLAPGATADEKAALEQLVKSPTALVADSEATRRLYRNLACRELWEDLSQLTLEKGRLVPMAGTHETVCEKRALDRPFDSARWEVPSRIFYLQGDRDPATPLWQARYHFERQKAPRHFLEVKGAGHNPLAVTARLAGCYDEIWAAVLGRGGVAAAAARCTIPVTVESR